MAATGCTNTESAPVTTTTVPPRGQCVATPSHPAVGLAAITDAFLVRAWTTPGSSDYTELPRLGDDPLVPNQRGNLAVVETATVSVATCAVFVGTCCEPVSGITYYGGELTGEWLMLMGRLPTVSPDGEKLAVVALEQLIITSVRNPEETEAVVFIPSGETTNFLDAHWLNQEEVGLFGANADGVFLWVVDVANATVGEPILITNDINWLSENLGAVSFAGVDDEENIAIRLPGPSGDVIQYRSGLIFDVTTSAPLRTNVFTYRIDRERSAMVTDAGVLSVWVGIDNPTQIGAGYIWAG